MEKAPKFKTRFPVSNICFLSSGFSWNFCFLISFIVLLISGPQSKQTCYSQELHTAQQWKNSTCTFASIEKITPLKQNCKYLTNIKTNEAFFLVFCKHCTLHSGGQNSNYTLLQKTHPFKNITNKQRNNARKHVIRRNCTVHTGGQNSNCTLLKCQLR